jgi:hypothetical protein
VIKERALRKRSALFLFQVSRSALLTILTVLAVASLIGPIGLARRLAVAAHLPGVVGVALLLLLAVGVVVLAHLPGVVLTLLLLLALGVVGVLVHALVGHFFLLGQRRGLAPIAALNRLTREVVPPIAPTRESG